MVAQIKVPGAKAGVKKLRSFSPGSQDPVHAGQPRNPELMASCLKDVESMEDSFGALQSLSMDVQARI